jgi:hypothetical protein
MRSSNPGTVRLALTAALVLGGAGLHAQPATGPRAPVVEMTAELSVEEMAGRVPGHAAALAGQLHRLGVLRDTAARTKDVIKLNCVDDKLQQGKELARIARAARAAFDAARAGADLPEMRHRYALVAIASDKLRVLRDDAEACVGEELDFLGEQDLGVGEPTIPDDPTRPGPYGAGVEAPGYDGSVEAPAFASPFE